MTREELISQIRKKRSYLCVGLDPDMDKIPSHLHDFDDPAFEFNKAIIDATRDYCVAYKPNMAFYECLGLNGWKALEKTIKYIGVDHFIIADAKRGDIGNTSAKYARAFFETLKCDAITVAPYMGKDSVEPFTQFPGKWVILLALTSNPGALDFQFIVTGPGEKLYEKVLETSAGWGTKENMMYVVGATRPEMLLTIRQHFPDHFLLVPGIGAQGGNLEEVSAYGLNADVGLLINASRSVLYASSGNDFAQAAGNEAMKLADEMKRILQKKK